ncbi:MAG: polyphenol oxidase family protein [Eggerthellaceae bacterium]|nr:polyphenol oxidase family protein [Eggerthellaceae bacterium]
MILPLPTLTEQAFDGICAYSDARLYKACGLRIAFTDRCGGVSKQAYSSLNLGMNVGDDPADVLENRNIAVSAIGGNPDLLIVPSQVHGTNIVVLKDCDEQSLEAARKEAAQGTDGLVIDCPGVSALMCFADCVPVIIASPQGAFGIMHAGWRGAVAGIVKKGIGIISALHGEDPSGFNVYVGPHICADCFECGDEVRLEFLKRYGAGVLAGERCVDLLYAVSADAMDAGVSADRICSADACTKCSPDKYFSFRASDGVCGRNGALAFRKEQ